MTLDDFFTLTEINNGLTALSRVRDLMAMMQKERDCAMKNAADSTRQRSSVASAISATENKDCLDLFLQLDGLHYISNWLKDAQQSSKESKDSFMGEHISHLLQVLKKLNIGYENQITLEILATVEKFLDHSCHEVQAKARVLLQSWKTERSIDESVLDICKARTLSNDEPKDIWCSETSVNNNESEIARGNKVLSTSLDSANHDQIKTMHDSNKISDPLTGYEVPLHCHVISPSSPKPAVGPAQSHSISTNNTFQPCSSVSSGQDTMMDFNALESKMPEDVTEPSPHVESDGKDEGDCTSYADQHRGSSDFMPKEGRDNNRRILPESSSTISWGNFLSGISNFVKANDLPVNHTPAKKQANREESEIKIDYGIVDPLEVARQVAMEVEREIVDYRENSCSSTEKLLGSNTNSLRAESPDSVSEKISDSPMDKTNGSSLSDESATSSENPDTDGTQDVATSQVTEAVQEEANTEVKGLCNFFDLNQEVMPEECDTPLSVSVVSASRPTPLACKPPGGPLEFEGNLGWKGSALTSAFRPASPRRVPEDERPGCGLDFDLNVCESVDDSSVDANSRKSRLLELDLNHTNENGGGAYLDWQIGPFYPQPSLVQPERRIDRNERPSFTTVSFDNSSYLTSKASQNFSNSAISIMGKRVEAELKDFFSPQTQPSQNGRNSEVALDYNLGRMGNFIGVGSALPYTHSPFYGYSNIPTGPTMPYSSAVYGADRHSIPYMVDLRGAPIVPQIMGSASGLPAPFSQTPILGNMNWPAMPPNGVGPSRSSFDLNPGMLAEGGNRDPSGFGLFLNSTHVSPGDAPSPQGTMGSSVGGKRKETDNGYSEQCYPFKQFMPHWKQS